MATKHIAKARNSSEQEPAYQEIDYDLNGKRLSIWDGSSGVAQQGQVYWGSKPVAFYKDNALHFQHGDWLGSERVTTSYNGATESSIGHYPFGEIKSSSGNPIDADQFGQLDHNIAANTEHAQFRELYNGDAHWLSPDPYDGSYDPTNPQSFNRYAYALNNPMRWTDRSGLDLDACTFDDGTSCEEGGGGGGGGDVGGGGGCAYDACVTANPDPPVDTYPTGCVINCGPVPPQSPPSVPPYGPKAPNNGPAPSACQATLLNMANQQLGTNFNSSNITGSYTNGTAYNIIIQSNQLTASQFNGIQQGRYTTSGWQYLTGAGLAGHIADETNLGFAQSAFQSSNVGGNLSVSFAFHDDHGFANNPIGALIHFFTDVLGHNTRKPC